jgi:glutamate synthase domain-containing protein 2
LVFALLTGVGVHDLLQKHHAILQELPIIGHLRFLLEFIRPEIRQYFIESENDEAPFSRAQRTIVYQRAENESDKRPFGTQTNVHASGYEWITTAFLPAAFPPATLESRLALSSAKNPTTSVCSTSPP